MSKYCIRIARNGLSLTLGEYVGIVNRVKAAPPGTMFKESFGSWWSTSREDILREFGRMVTDKINEHLTLRELSDARLLAKLRRHVKSDCRWCGESLGRYEPKEMRFCCADCRRCFYW